MVHVLTESSRSASYTVVALKASPITGTPLGPIMNGVRIGLVAVTLLVSIALLILALHVPPFMPAGADLADSGQRHYAANIWQETQTSLALVAIVLPWLVYGLLWRGAPWGRRILLATAAAAVAVTTWFVLLSAQSYTALPRLPRAVGWRAQRRSFLACPRNRGHGVGLAPRPCWLAKRGARHEAVIDRLPGLGGLGLGAQAPGAHQGRLGAAVDGDLCLVQIGHEAALRVHLRVTHVMPVLRPLTADRATLCHGVGLLS